MPSPFPGMDPYLEDPESWRGTHLLLIAEMSKELNRQLRPQYVTRVEERVYVSEFDDAAFIIPDARILRGRGDRPRGSTAVLERPAATEPRTYTLAREVKERYLVIRKLPRREIVTVVELLSPTNKARGSKGYRVYRRKRRQIVQSMTNLVEIDLLRAGRPMVPASIAGAGDYRVVVVKSSDPDRGYVWPVRMDEPLPVVTVPLDTSKARGVLDMQKILTDVYDSGPFADDIDYTQPPIPPLTPAQSAWAKKLLKARR